MSIAFPLFVLSKDSGEVHRFDSVHEMQKQLEEIDVENSEYLAWDQEGNPVSITVQKPIWLKLEQNQGLEQSDLKKSLEKYAAALGMDITLRDASADELNRAYEQIDSEAKLRVRPGFWGRILRGR